MRIFYVAVAGFCALLHNVIIIGMDRVGVHYAFASIVSFFVVAATGFLLHCAITFRTRATLRSFVRYLGAMAFNLPLSIAALFLFHDVAKLPMLLASPVATVALFVINYFLSAWGPRYTPILESADPNEQPQQGGMVMAKVGKGTYIYTGYGFFRQLPDGVPGAYRLFANLISIEN
jgi:putative flippase GtrA